MGIPTPFCNCYEFVNVLLFQRQVYLILQDPLRASRTCRSCPRINSKYSSIGAYIKHIFSVFSSGFSWVRHGFNDVISRASLELQSCFSLTSLVLQCHFVRSCCKLFFYGSGNSFYSTLQELSHSELLCCSSGSSTAPRPLNVRFCKVLAACSPHNVNFISGLFLYLPPPFV